MSVLHWLVAFLRPDSSDQTMELMFFPTYWGSWVMKFLFTVLPPLPWLHLLYIIQLHLLYYRYYLNVITLYVEGHL